MVESMAAGEIVNLLNEVDILGDEHEQSVMLDDFKRGGIGTGG